MTARECSSGGVKLVLEPINARQGYSKRGRNGDVNNGMRIMKRRELENSAGTRTKGAREQEYASCDTYMDPSDWKSLPHPKILSSSPVHRFMMAGKSTRLLSSD